MQNYINQQQSYYSQIFDDPSIQTLNTKIKKPKFTYIFPIKLINFNSLIKGKQQFRSLMNQEAIQIGSPYQKDWIIERKVYTNFKTKSNTNQQTKIRYYVRCLRCKANIRYHENQDLTWTLMNYMNLHTHYQLPPQKKYKNLTDELITQNIHLPDQQLFQIVSKSAKAFPINRTSLFKAKKSILRKSTFQEFFKYFKYDYKIQLNPQDMSNEQYPQNLVAVSQYHKLNYQRFGEVIFFHTQANCIKQTSFVGSRYTVGIFSGFDNYNRLILFGFSISSNRKVNTLKTIFEWFLVMMKASSKIDTITFVIDKKHDLNVALNQLKIQLSTQWKIHHIYDSVDFIEKFTYFCLNDKILKQQKFSFQKDDLGYFLKNIICEGNPSIGIVKLLKFKEWMAKHGLIKFYETFEANLEKSCLWRMPNQFTGLIFEKTKSLHEILKLKNQNELTLYTFIQRFDIVSKQIPQKFNSKILYQFYPFEDYFDDQLLHEIRMAFEKTVFNSFMFNYNRAQFYQLVKSNTIGTIFIIKHKIQGYKFQLNATKCTCGLTEKIGIPCQHIIFLHKYNLLGKQTESYIPLFDMRWLPTKQVTKKIRKGRKIIQ